MIRCGYSVQKISTSRKRNNYMSAFSSQGVNNGRAKLRRISNGDDQYGVSAEFVIPARPKGRNLDFSRSDSPVCKLHDSGTVKKKMDKEIESGELEKKQVAAAIELKKKRDAEREAAAIELERKRAEREAAAIELKKRRDAERKAIEEMKPTIYIQDYYAIMKYMQDLCGPEFGLGYNSFLKRKLDAEQEAAAIEWKKKCDAEREAAAIELKKKQEAAAIELKKKRDAERKAREEMKPTIYIQDNFAIMKYMQDLMGPEFGLGYYPRST